MIILPFPPASLSGHNEGHWRANLNNIKSFRMLAAVETRKARLVVPKEGDIPIHFRFVPPNNMGDRVNFPIRIKPLIDGIADGLQVNDKRFLPSYEFADPEKPGRVEVRIGDIANAAK